jgi:(E)-4-hydroxy-3-methylbut-2-enyl-diphosphate synthase
MKASNPKVMIQAYRLLVERMAQEDMHYPLHLGVTEAGDGEDGRIKSAIGIGSLLLDGLGDTIRVSLTEDSVYEIPVARAIADKAMSLWTAPRPDESTLPLADTIDPYHFSKRETAVLRFSDKCAVGPEQPPRVIVRSTLAGLADAAKALAAPRLIDTPAEGLLVPVNSVTDIDLLCRSGFRPDTSGLNPDLPIQFLALELAPSLTPADLESTIRNRKSPILLVRRFEAGETARLTAFAELVRRHGHFLAVEIDPENFGPYEDALRKLGDASLLFTLSTLRPQAIAAHGIGAHRRLLEHLKAAGSKAPVWIRNTSAMTVRGDNSFLSKLLEASFLTGSLLCDGIGDLVSIETEADPARATKLAYNVLQGAGARISKTEFVACPSCGRTLFDLQTTTQRIRAQTGHLKGVKIAIMGCIVNGPGEMADADFGYVGGAPGKINLYVGKNCVQYNIPQVEADARLIALIREHGKWADPEPHQLASA